MIPARANRPGSVWLVEILIATDASWVVDEVTAALGADGVNFTVCREGRVVADEVKKNTPDVALIDMQIGSMGGMAGTMSLRLDESSGLLPPLRRMVTVACIQHEPAHWIRYSCSRILRSVLPIATLALHM